LRPVTWRLTASLLANCLSQCHIAHHVDHDEAATDHVARDNMYGLKRKISTLESKRRFPRFTVKNPCCYYYH